MSRAFQYRPKTVDIRVRPPREDETTGPDDVFTLKPGERACDHAGCRTAATARCPKSRDMLNEHYWFCAPHAAQYNKSWDFFAGMNEAQVRAAQEARATGERPTWAFRASPHAREAAASRARGVDDGFGLFGKERARPVVDPLAGAAFATVEHAVLLEVRAVDDALAFAAACLDKSQYSLLGIDRLRRRQAVLVAIHPAHELPLSLESGDTLFHLIDGDRQTEVEGCLRQLDRIESCLRFEALLVAIADLGASSMQMQDGLRALRVKLARKDDTLLEAIQLVLNELNGVNNRPEAYR
mgnify:CR=1 FL=1